jgi:hypothetical protein
MITHPSEDLLTPACPVGGLDSIKEFILFSTLPTNLTGNNLIFLFSLTNVVLHEAIPSTNSDNFSENLLLVVAARQKLSLFVWGKGILFYTSLAEVVDLQIPV